MAEFIDSKGETWTVELDGISLGELRDCGIDVVQDGLYAIEHDEVALCKALRVLCKEQKEARKLSDKQFAARLVAETADKAIAAVRGAAENFFRPKRWSEIQSRSAMRQEADQMFQSIRPMLQMLDKPEMGEMREPVMVALKELIGSASSSANSGKQESVSDQDSSQPNSAGD